ncbi:hypothetical protein ABFE25_26975 [Bacillus toyonensis]|uniref:hypothetical protein n=1 Tax=Bacillus toyonensis TaxID=155322 RepID=UPI00321AB47A
MKENLDCIYKYPSTEVPEMYVHLDVSHSTLGYSDDYFVDPNNGELKGTLLDALQKIYKYGLTEEFLPVTAFSGKVAERIQFKIHLPQQDAYIVCKMMVVILYF